MIISYINSIDSLSLDASSAELDYPVTNVQQIHLSKKWRATDCTLETITIDTTALNPDAAFVAGTNLSATGTITLQGNATDSWSSPAVEIILTENDGVYYTYSTDFEELRYWRFVFEDEDNVDGYISVGRLWLGNTISVNGPAKSFVQKRNNTSQTTISLSGQVYGDVGYIYKTWDMAYPYWDNTEKETIELFSDTVNKAQPFFVQFADTGANKLGPYYVILTNDIDITHMRTLNIWSSQLSFMEVK